MIDTSYALLCFLSSHSAHTNMVHAKKSIRMTFLELLSNDSVLLGIWEGMWSVRKDRQANASKVESIDAQIKVLVKQKAEAKKLAREQSQWETDLVDQETARLRDLCKELRRQRLRDMLTIRAQALRTGKEMRSVARQACIPRRYDTQPGLTPLTLHPTTLTKKTDGRGKKTI